MPGGTETEHTHVPETEAVRSPAAVRGHPIHPMLIPMPIGLLVGALVADLLFVGTEDEFFARMALWLLGGGLLTGAFAAVFGIADFAVLQRPRQLRAGWVHAVGNGLAMLLALGNLGLRLAQGAEEAIRPVGLVLSVVIALLLAITGWYGGELTYRYLVGVRPEESTIRRREERAE